MRAKKKMVKFVKEKTERMETVGRTYKRDIHLEYFFQKTKTPKSSRSASDRDPHRHRLGSPILLTIRVINNAFVLYGVFELVLYPLHVSVRKRPHKKNMPRYRKQ